MELVKAVITKRKTFLLTGLVGLFAAVIFLPSQLGNKAEAQREKGLFRRSTSVEANFPNFDIRDRSGTKSDPAEKFRGTDKASFMADTVARGELRLRKAVPGLKIEVNPYLANPEVVTSDPVKGYAALARSRGDRVGTLRDFLKSNSSLFGIDNSEINGLTVTADYTNPAGNLSFVRMEQTINGVPVFLGEVNGAFSRDGDLFRVTNTTAPALDRSSLAGEFGDPADAVRSAFKFVSRPMTEGDTAKDEEHSTDLKAVFRGGGGDDATVAEKMYFPIEAGNVRPAWRVMIWQPVNAYYVIVDAATGEMLWRKNLTNDQTQPVQYNVYNNDSPAPFSPTTALPGSGTQGATISRSDVSVINEMPTGQPYSTDPWLADGAGNVVTTGNNVDAGIDVDGTNGIDPTGRATGAGRVLSFTYDPFVDAPSTTAFRNGAVTNIFFWTNRYHDWVYQYGFTELARNFQTNNYGRGGLGNDFVRAEAQDSSGTNNANFATGADGALPRMQMYIFPGPNPDRDGDLDGDVFIHEMTHGLSNRLHNNGAGLTTTQAGGMGEGWSDFYARSLLSSAGEDVNGLYASGNYATLQLGSLGTNNTYYGIRRFPYAVKTNVGANSKPHYPLTFADIDPAQVNTTDGAFPESPLNFTVNNGAAEVHNIGEIWAMMLFEVRARVITRLGYAAGNQRMVQIVTDAMKLDVASPTLVQARDSILAADQAGFGGVDVADIWAGFATRGNGFGSSVTGTATVVESYLLPNAIVTNPITFTDAAPGGNGNGFADPGEVLVLTVPVTNTTGNTMTNVVVTASTGGSANYGSVANGATVTRTFNVPIAAGAVCGSTVTVGLNLTSDAGAQPVTNKNIPVGQPIVGLTQNFDGAIVPTLPAGWTTTLVGTGPLAWVTSATSPDTAPNDAFTNDPATPGESSLVTPDIAISSTSAQLSFRHSFVTENLFDGGVLEISIGGGAFQSITTAGGTFASGGYTSTLTPFAGCAATPNPLGAVPAWTGNSGGYITTVVNIPAAANGQNVKFRWRAGSDCSVGSTGWRVDTVQVINGFSCSVFTAADATISGRVVSEDGRGITNAKVQLMDQFGMARTVITGRNGSFVFNEVSTGAAYTVSVWSRRFSFEPQVVQVNDNVSDLIFHANP